MGFKIQALLPLVEKRAKIQAVSLRVEALIDLGLSHVSTLACAKQLYEKNAAQLNLVFNALEDVSKVEDCDAKHSDSPQTPLKKRGKYFKCSLLRRI